MLGPMLDYTEDIQFVSAGTEAGEAPSNTFSPPLPSVMDAGDLLLLVFMNDTPGAPTISTSGWNTVISYDSSPANSNLYVYWKYAGASESAPTLTVAASNGGGAQIFAYRGLREINAVSAGTNATTSTSLSTGTLTTTTPNSLVISLWVAKNAGYGTADQPVTGTTLRSWAVDSTMIGLYDEVQSAAGSTTARTLTYTTTIADISAVQIAFQRRATSAIDPYWSSVVAYIPFVGSNGSSTFVNAKNGDTMNVSGTPKIDYTFYKFWPASTRFDGTAAYVDGAGLGRSTDFTFGTGDFTMECWYYLTSAGTNHGLIDLRLNNTDLAPMIYFHDLGMLIFARANGLTTINGSSTNPYTVVTGQWVHVAVSRNSGVSRMFVNGNINGTSSAGVADTYNYVGSTKAPTIGSYAVSPTVYLNGYLQDVRITKGVGRYTAAFTPPTRSFSTG